MGVMCLKGNGCGMKTINCITLENAAYWMKGSSAQNMAELICSIPNADGNPNIATYPLCMSPEKENDIEESKLWA